MVVDVASTSLTQRMASCGQPCRPPGLWVYALVCLPAGRYLSARRSRMRVCRMWCQQIQMHLINCKTYFQTNFDSAINRYNFYNFQSIPHHSEFFRTQETPT